MVYEFYGRISDFQRQSAFLTEYLSEQKLAMPGGFQAMERETGLEPATPCLEGRNSTTELLPQN